MTPVLENFWLTKHPLLGVKSAECYLLALLVVFGRGV